MRFLPRSSVPSPPHRSYPAVPPQITLTINSGTFAGSKVEDLADLADGDSLLLTIEAGEPDAAPSDGSVVGAIKKGGVLLGLTPASQEETAAWLATFVRNPDVAKDIAGWKAILPAEGGPGVPTEAGIAETLTKVAPSFEVRTSRVVGSIGCVWFAGVWQFAGALT